MEPLYSTQIATDFGEKEISVYSCDITKFDREIDVLTTSAFVNSYEPTPRTMFRALKDIGISVKELSYFPEIDLRTPCNTWLSKEILPKERKIHRIGCIELINYFANVSDDTKSEQTMLNSIRSYFSMLDIASFIGVKMETVVMPLLGSGNQHISANLIIVPLLNECVSFLKRNGEVKRILFVEKNDDKAKFIAEYISKSYNILTHANSSAENPEEQKKTCAFISYASEDKNIADNLCSKLESKGVRVWYAPRDVKGPYAEAIAQAIDNCSHFIVILSQNSMISEHVLNEIDLAFQLLPKIKFKPLRIDKSIFTPSFKYYLSRQHWMDAIIPPLEDRLNEFVEDFLTDI